MLTTEVRRPGLALGTFHYEKIYQTVSIAKCIFIMFIGYLLLSILKRRKLDFNIGEKKLFH